MDDPNKWIFSIYSSSCFCCIFPLRFVSSHDQILRVQLAEAPARVHAGGRLLRQVWWGRKVLTAPEVLCIDYRLFSPSCYHPLHLRTILVRPTQTIEPPPCSFFLLIVWVVAGARAHRSILIKNLQHGDGESARLTSKSIFLAVFLES